MAESQDRIQRLQAYLKDRFPQRPGLKVTELERMPVGVSYETYLATMTWNEGQGVLSESLIIRMEPEFGCIPPYDIRPQWEALTRLYGTGIPVPKAHWLELDTEALGHPFFAMEKIEAEEVLDEAWRNHPEQQSALAQDYAQILARIHGLDWQALRLSVLGVPDSSRQYAEQEIARWQRVMEENQYSSHPVVAELIIWLKRNIPRHGQATLCHGDYQPRNMLVREGRIVAVLDWEMVGIGDPVSELGWASMFMTTVLMGRFWNEADFIRSYEEMAGLKVTEESLFFWKVLACVKLTAIALAGIKTGIESRDLDVRHLGVWTIFLPLLQDAPARMLGF